MTISPTIATTLKETWGYDSTKRNWAVHSYNKFNFQGAPQWDRRGFYERTMTFNEADQPTQEVIKRSEFVSGVWQESATVETNQIRFDKRGNMWADGRRVFNYDAYNRLTGVWERSTAPNAHIEDKGDPIAAFTYDGYGHRLTARYNSTKPETDQTTLDDDPVDIYSYDHLWRIRTVTEATHTQEGWTSFVREQWFYHTGSDPTSYKIGSDAPVMRRIDLNGDGTFEETQNFVTDRQGSVVAVLGDAVSVDVNNESLGMKPGELIARVRYDTYGVPTICDPADIDRDGVVDIADVALYCGYWNAWHNAPTAAVAARYKEILDYNRDGVVDANDPCTSSNADYLALTTRAGLVMTEVVPDVKDVVGNLPLYAGYWWDAQLEMYHVRHRVYRPEWGKWIQRDPLGYAAGWNLYEYVGGEPWRDFDPEVLMTWGDAWTITKEFFKGAGDGVLIITNALTFKQIDSLNEHVEDLVEQNGWTYSVSQFAADVAREALFAAGTMGLGKLAQGATALARVARYTLPLVVAYDVITGTQQIGTGIGKLMEGDSSGWKDIALGGIRVFGGAMGARGLKAGGCKAAQGAAANAKGISREQKVAERIGGTVSRQRIKNKYGSSDVDVKGPNGELIGVGGPAKAMDRAKFGRQLQVLKESARESGVPAQMHFEEGTPQDAIDLAIKWLGPQNVKIFPK